MDNFGAEFLPTNSVNGGKRRYNNSTVMLAVIVMACGEGQVHVVDPVLRKVMGAGLHAGGIPQISPECSLHTRLYIRL